MNDYGHWAECETCTRLFRSQRACNQHMNQLDHWAPTFECETCTREFRSQNAANQHMNAVGHWRPRIPCETCNEKFHSEEDADTHMQRLGHWRNYCKACDRRFLNDNNLCALSLASPYSGTAADVSGHIIAPQLQDPPRNQSLMPLLQSNLRLSEWSLSPS